MRTSILSIVALVFVMNLQAQQFINKAVVEFEVKANIRKSIGDGMWADMMKENMPPFKVAYYKYTFANNKSHYKLDRFDEKIKIPEYMKKQEEDNEWYVDHNQQMLDMKKIVVGSPFNVKDSLPAIAWKLTNENMMIAGFNCRKAVGKIFDSVYVFAFYSDEITISGGPCSIGGLPGMILGMTIPRLYTSWIATKVSITNVNEAPLKPLTGKNPFLQKNYNKFLADRTKEWAAYGEDQAAIEQFLWQALL